MGRDVYCKAWVGKWASAKKGGLVRELARAFADPNKFSSGKETEEKLRTCAGRPNLYRPEAIRPYVQLREQDVDRSAR